MRPAAGRSICLLRSLRQSRFGAAALRQSCAAQILDNDGAASALVMETRPESLRILLVVNGAWDPRFGAVRVWMELAAEWTKAGNLVEKFCLTDAFPTATSSSALAAFRLLLFPFRAASFVRRNADRFDVIDAHIGTLPFSKQSLRWSGLLVARSVGLYRLYEKFEEAAAKRWPPLEKGKLSGRIFTDCSRSECVRRPRHRSNTVIC